MEVDTIFGLPAHPLFVHLPIVLIPITALAAVLLAFKPDLREGYAHVLVAVIAIAAVATIMAAGAGEQLEKRVGEDELVERHAELGEQARLIAVLFAAAAIAMLVAIRRHMARAVAPLTILVALLGVVATVSVTRAGHAGAESVWKQVADAPVAGEDD